MKKSDWDRVCFGLVLLMASSLAVAQTLDPPTVRKTVGTSASQCAPQSEITVLQGTDVFFCYTITNPNEVPLQYNLTDNVLGNIGSGMVDGFDSDTIKGVSESVNASVTNIATWYYTDEIENDTSPALAGAAHLRSAPADSGQVNGSATVNVVTALVPTLSDAGMLLFGIAVVGCALLLLRRTA